MRRRLLGDSSIPDVYATFVQHMDAQPGDVVFYDTKTNGRSYYRLDEGDDLIPKTCVPIGIIAIPVGNEFYPSSDICSAISLCHMSSKDVQGDITPEEIMWGDDTVDINANWQIIDGKITTQMILDIRGDIGGDIDFDNPSHYPAASSCNAYYTVGTKPGDWYLPSYYELVYGIPSNIDEVLSKLRDIYGEYKIMEYLPLDLYGWSSNDYGAKFAFATWMLTQESIGKTARCYVVAFTQLSSNLERNYGDILISGGSTTDIPASGGSSQVTGYTYSQTYGYGDSTTNGGVITSGATIEATTVSANSLGTTVKDRAKVGSSVLTISMNGKTATAKYDVYQSANKQTLDSIDAYANYSSNPPSAIPQNDWLNAGGGYIDGKCVANYSYTSGSTDQADVTSSTTWTSQGNYGSISGNRFTVSSRGTTTGNDRYNYIYASFGGKSDSFNTGNYRNERWTTGTSGGAYSYGNVSAGTITNATIGAGGGSATAKAGNGSQTWSRTAITTYYEYTSGSTSSAVTSAASSGTNSIAPSSSSYTASASSKGTTESAATTIGTKAVTWSGSGGKSASGTMYVWQAANSMYNCKTSLSLSATNITAYSQTVTASGTWEFQFDSGSSIKSSEATSYSSQTIGSNKPVIQLSNGILYLLFSVNSTGSQCRTGVSLAREYNGKKYYTTQYVITQSA